MDDTKEKEFEKRLEDGTLCCGCGAEQTGNNPPYSRCDRCRNTLSSTADWQTLFESEGYTTIVL